MPVPHLRALVGAAALALVGACASPSETTPEPTSSKPAAVEPTVPEPTVPEPTAPAPTPAVVEPAPVVTEPTPAPAPPAPTSTTLRAAAVREGSIALLRQRDAPLLVIDGEPLPLVDGAFTRHPTGSAGIWADKPSDAETTIVLAATSLDEPLGAWTSTVHEPMRSAYTYDVYQRDGKEWQPQRLRKGLLVAYYAAFVERDGALLALRSWAADPAQQETESEEENPKADAYQAKLTRALARAKQQWVRIAGAEPAVVPEIPAGVTLVDSAVTTTADGTLMALAEETPAGGTQTVLLVWPPGQASAERAAVPELAKARLPTLVSSGEWALVGASLDGETGTEQSYVALGRGREWQRVPVSLPGRSSGVATISGAARMPDGEVWIALANRFEGGGDRQPVWRKPVEGPWQPVRLPAVGGKAFGPAKDWVRDGTYDDRGWVETERSRAATVPEQAPSLLFVGGAVWIVVEGQTAYEDVGEPPSRTVVLTNAPGTAPPQVLPSEWQLALERRNHALRGAEPGDTKCEGFALTLGPATLAKEAPALVTTLVAIKVPYAEGNDASTRAIYVAERKGKEVLVADAFADSPAQAVALREAVVAAMTAAGVPTQAVAADCRIPEIDRMVEMFDNGL